MKFSIIIPSYGQAQYLTEAIESALAQSYNEPYEVIVVDDGSTDGSYEIARTYVPRIKVIRQTNRGLASARNTGIMNSTGEWVIPLDADDIMDPNALREFDKYSGDFRALVIAPSITCFNEKGDTVLTTLKANPVLEDFKEGNRLAYFAAIRRKVLLELGGYSTKMDVLGGWEDLHLWYNIFSHKLPWQLPFLTLPLPLLSYRVKEESMWKTAEKNRVKLWEQIVKDFPHVQDHAKN